MIHSTFHSLQQAKIAVSFAKWSSSSYKQTFTKFSRGEKALSSSHFQIFKLQLLSASFSSPDAWSFSFFNASYSDLLSVGDHETLGNWSVSRIMPLQLRTSSSICLVSVIPPPSGLVFLLIVVEWPVSLKLPAVNSWAWFNNQYYQLTTILQGNGWVHHIRAWQNILWSPAGKNQVGSQKEVSSEARGFCQPQRRVRLKSQPSETRAVYAINWTSNGF